MNNSVDISILNMYSDLTPDMDITWDKDLNTALDSRAVRNSIMGIVSTRKGSRPFYPEFGCDLPKQLFETMNPLVMNTIQINISDAIRNNEPRVKKLNVLVTPDYDGNAIYVEVRFSIIDNPDELELLKIRLQK